VTIAWHGFFLEFSPKIQKGVLYLESLVTNIATVTIGGTLPASYSDENSMRDDRFLKPKFINDNSVGEDKYLWRYIDLHKFLSFVTTKSIFLTRLDKFEDKREGIALNHIIYKNLKRKLDNNPIFSEISKYATVDNLGPTMNKIEDDLKIIQRFNFASCWVLCDGNHESVAMWNLYSSPNSIALRIKYSDFKALFQTEKIMDYGLSESIICSPIQYFDFQQDSKILELLKNKDVDTIFLKDSSFEHEKEFRIVFKEKVREIPAVNYKEGISRKHIEKFHNSMYNYPGKSIELNHFKDYPFEIIFHPKSEEWAKSNIKEVVKEFKIPFKIFESELELK
jgi:hypothetical protein